MIEIGSLSVSRRQSSEASGVYQQHKTSGSWKCTSEVIHTCACICTHPQTHIFIHPSINDLLRVHSLRFPAVWEASGEVPAEERLGLSSAHTPVWENDGQSYTHM